MSNIAPIAYDAESEAYLQRYPELRAPLAQYGANGARLHWQNYGQNEGRTWGAAPAAPATPAAPVETAATRPLSPAYGSDAAGWDAYIDAGRRAAEGINQMPGVFSDYGAVPTDDKAANALFAVTPAAATQASNALLTGMATGGSAFGAPAGGTMASNALLSPSQQLDRILDMGPGAFAEAPGNVFQRQVGMPIDEMEFYQKGYDYYAR